MKQTAICKSKDQCHPQLTADGTQTRTAERSLFVFPALSSIVCAALEEMESISFPLCQPQPSSEGLVSRKASIFDGLWWLLCSQGEEEQTPVSALPASVQCSMEGSAPCPYVPEGGPLPTKPSPQLMQSYRPPHPSRGMQQGGFDGVQDHQPGCKPLLPAPWAWGTRQEPSCPVTVTI